MRPRQNRARKTIIVIACFMIAISAGALKASSVAAEVREQTVMTLKIEGMTCGACVKDVRAALERVSGVNTVEIHVGTKWFFFSDYADARALVAIDPEQVTPEELIQTVESSSMAVSTYNARLIRDN